MRRWIRPPALKPLALLAAALLIAAGVHWLLPADAAREPAGSANSAHTGQQAAGQPAQQKRAVPVLATAASARDFPIIIRGLGSVQAFNTVTVKSRVDGQITQVAFQEGQHVKAGDVLMQIDPRPYATRASHCEQGEGRSQSSERAARSGPPCGASTDASGPDAAAKRHAKGAGRSADRGSSGRSGADRRGQAQRRLRDGALADRGNYRL